MKNPGSTIGALSAREGRLIYFHHPWDFFFPRPTMLTSADDGAFRQLGDRVNDEAEAFCLQPSNLPRCPNVGLMPVSP